MKIPYLAPGGYLSFTKFYLLSVSRCLLSASCMPDPGSRVMISLSGKDVQRAEATCLRPHGFRVHPVFTEHLQRARHLGKSCKHLWEDEVIASISQMREQRPRTVILHEIIKTPPPPALDKVVTLPTPIRAPLPPGPK